MNTSEKLAKAQAREDKAAERERLAIVERRKAAIKRKAQEDAIRDARAFIMGRALLAYFAENPKSRDSWAPVFNRLITNPRDRETVADLLGPPRSYDALQQVAK